MITSKQIYKIVCRHFDLDLSSRCRNNTYIYARSLYYKLSKDLTIDSLAKMGSHCKRDHATVLNGLKKFDEVYVKYNEAFNVTQEYTFISKKLSEVMSNNNVDIKEYESITDYIKYLNERVKDYSLLKANYNHLQAQYSKVNGELQMYKKFYENEDLLEINNELLNLKPKELRDFKDLRVKPFIALRKNIKKLQSIE